MEINSELLNIENINNCLYNILYKKKKIMIQIDNVITPFGIESNNFNNKKQYYTKIEMNKDKINFFIDFENKIQIMLGNIKNNSQIINSEKFNSKLKVKIKSINDKIQTKCFEKNKEISIFDIKCKKLNINMTPVLYYDDTKFIIKWNVIKIICV